MGGSAQGTDPAGGQIDRHVAGHHPRPRTVFLMGGRSVQVTPARYIVSAQSVLSEH